jgi:oxygen-independent coproporphyrinogen-3 oxidase
LSPINHPMQPPTRNLYIHVPFCTRRCSYCDFAIAVRRSVPVTDFIDGIASEFTRRAATLNVGKLDTLYFGGGTPSKLGALGISGIIDRLKSIDHFDLAASAEVTIEANPEDINEQSAAAWVAAGVNRLSVGVQSFDPKVLEWMHRSHSATATTTAINAAKSAGITDISLDLIFAIPSELNRDWQRDLDLALALEPTHLSLYGLTVEPHTPLGKWTARGEVEEAPEDRYADEFLAAHSTMTAAGFEHYEVSNFGRPNRHSRHNSSYWERVPYLGLGPSAHSFDGAERRWNEREYEAWRERTTREDPVGGAELLDADNEIAELVYLGLRTTNGLELRDTDTATVDSWVANGWAAVAKNRVTLSIEGWLRLDSLAADLTSARSR